MKPIQKCVAQEEKVEFELWGTGTPLVPEFNILLRLSSECER
jgi:hypothetical protein